jgi:S1-C subfamily serine protease
VKRTAVLSAALCAVVAAGCGSSTTVVTKVQVQVRTTTVAAPAAGGRTSVADVVARVLPGVVNIQTVDFDGSSGTASGVVIDVHGIIVTNNHVIEGARTVTVFFNDGRHHRPVRAVVVGTAPERDLAIIRVGLDHLVSVPLGRSSRLRLGDGVLALGFPLDLGGPTVTQGIVSGLNRTFQTDTGPPL